MSEPDSPHVTAAPLVAILAYQQLGLFEFGCAVGLFAPQRPELEVEWYRSVVCACEPDALKTLGGCLLQAPATLDRLDDADVIVIPGWRNPDECPPAALLDKLRAAHARGARLASICSGAFVLAYAGLLDGRSATTHWRLTDLLANRFPAIEVRANVLYVDTGSILTSAGSATGMDMLLHMVRKDYGTHVASTVAQRWCWRRGAMASAASWSTARSRSANRTGLRCSPNGSAAIWTNRTPWPAWPSVPPSANARCNGSFSKLPGCRRSTG